MMLTGGNLLSFSSRMGPTLLVASLVAVSMLAEFAHGAGAFGICDVKFGGARGGLMRLRGGASAAAQMAAIRAERAKNFEAEKQREDAAEAAEVEGFDGAGKAWCYAKGKVGPETVGTKKQEMAKGDARNFYFEEGATVLRNKKTGMVIELLDGSRGWFLFSSMEGGPVQQVSKEGNILGVSRWYVSGLIEDVKANPLKSSMVKAAGYRSGNWKITMDGRRMVLTNDFWAGFSVQLTEEGFFVINDNRGEAMQFKLAESEPERMPSNDARELLMTV